MTTTTLILPGWLDCSEHWTPYQIIPSRSMRGFYFLIIPNVCWIATLGAEEIGQLMGGN